MIKICCFYLSHSTEAQASSVFRCFRSPDFNSPVADMFRNLTVRPTIYHYLHLISKQVAFIEVYSHVINFIITIHHHISDSECLNVIIQAIFFLW